MKKRQFWLKLCIFNFFIVSVIGVMMRYNMAFSLPGFDHKYMQESHSHFAFYGWVAACIYFFVTDYLDKSPTKINLSKYQFLMFTNQIGSYGMLISFLFGGYFWLSIVFSAISLLTGFAFFIFLWFDTKTIQETEIIWLRAGAFFATLSSVGIFGLAYFSSKKEVFEVLFRASTYFYLHYQYNGFFLFSCVGLFLISLKNRGIIIPEKLNRSIFYLLLIGCFFGYGLSILWIDMPGVFNAFFAITSLIQLFGAFQLGIFVWQNRNKLSKYFLIQKILLTIVGFAFLLKFILQATSAIPFLGAYAFNSITIVIAYLHLILLMGVSLFIIWKMLDLEYFKMNRLLIISVFVLVFGVVLNEIILILAAISSFFLIPFLNSVYWLLFASVSIMVSIGLFFKSIKM